MHHRSVAAIITLCCFVALGGVSCRGRAGRAQAALDRRGLELTEEELLEAMQLDDREAARLFIEAGVTPGGALLVAAKGGRCEALAGLLEGGLEITGTNGAEALIVASRRGHRRCVEHLQQRGAILGGRNIFGESLLLRTAGRRSNRQFRYLLDHGADPNQASWAGETPLMAASAAGRDKKVKLLLKAGADLEATDVDGWTALLFAVRSGHGSTARRLLAVGAEVDVISHLGWTPLMWAARDGRVELVEDLLAAGADMDLKSEAGRSALIQATAQQHHGVVELLLRAGARTDLSVDGVDARWWAATAGWSDFDMLEGQLAERTRE